MLMQRNSANYWNRQQIQFIVLTRLADDDISQLSSSLDWQICGRIGLSSKSSSSLIVNERDDENIIWLTFTSWIDSWWYNSTRPRIKSILSIGLSYSSINSSGKIKFNLTRCHRSVKWSIDRNRISSGFPQLTGIFSVVAWTKNASRVKVILKNFHSWFKV